MFDIGFSELLVIFIVGLVVLGPARLPVAVRTVASWIRTLRSLATSVQHELSQELKLQELQDSLKKAEQSGLQNLTPELKASMDELTEAAKLMQQGYHREPTEYHREDATKEPQTIHQPVDLKAYPNEQTVLADKGNCHHPGDNEVIVKPQQHSVASVAEPSTTPQATLNDSTKHGRE